MGRKNLPLTNERDMNIIHTEEQMGNLVGPTFSCDLQVQ